MDLEIEQDLYENLTEIYIISENVVEVTTRNDRTFRIFAKETLRGPHRFSASYDELVRGIFQIENESDNDHSVWIRTHEMPWQDGETIEGCLRAAMSWVNDRGA